MEVWAEDQLTRRERLRAERELEHSAPARIRLKLAGVVVLVIAVLTWLGVSWLSTTGPTGAPVPDPPALQGAGQSGTDAAGTAESSGPSGPSPPNSSAAPAVPGSGGGAGTGSPPPGTSEGPPGAEQPSPVVVHVAGAVEDPGVVELPAEARVHEAIEAAGGMTAEADPRGLNLAAPVQDGTVIWVPTPEELEAGTGPPAAGREAAGPPGAEAGAQAESGAGSGVGPDPGAGSLINLNTADAATLDELPGIGPALSERIITYREANGPFGSLEELAGVSGIGPVTLADVEGLVTW